MLLYTILPKAEEELKGWLAGAVNRHGIVEGANYLYRTGTVPVLLVCHLDTVHARPPTEEEILINRQGTLISAPTVGIGGDDRCGVYAVLKLLERVDCHAVFTCGEEEGGVGARDFAADFARSAMAKEIKFAVEIDRRGENDAVFYDCDNTEFIDFVLEDKFYEEAHGSFTDICYICPELGFSGVNVSSGYYNPHTASEYINLGHLLHAVNHVHNMVTRGMHGKRYAWVERLGRYGTASYLDWYGSCEGHHGPCDFCGLESDDLVRCGQYELCPDCDATVDFCWNCQQPFYTSELTPVDGVYLCEECAGVCGGVIDK